MNTYLIPWEYPPGEQVPYKNAYSVVARSPRDAMRKFKASSSGRWRIAKGAVIKSHRNPDPKAVRQLFHAWDTGSKQLPELLSKIPCGDTPPTTEEMRAEWRNQLEKYRAARRVKKK